MALESPATPSPQARFQLMVVPHLERLLAFAHRQLGNLADAEDVVQDSCTRAWLAFGDLQDDSRMRPWLYRILRSSLSDFRDKRGRRERLTSLAEMGPVQDQPMTVDEPGPFEHLVAALSQERIHELLHTIPEEFAAAVELHDIEGFRYREIGEILGVATGTVMSRIYRGRKLIAVLIARERGLDSLGRRARLAGRPLQQRQA